MSYWHRVDEKEDVEISDDGIDIEILFLSDHQGNHYVEIPIELVKKVIIEHELKQNQKIKDEQAKAGSNDL